MKRLLALIFIFAYSFALAQLPRLIKYNVGDTNAKLYLPQVPIWEKSETEDKSVVYTTSVKQGEAVFGAVVVKLSQETLAAKQNPEELMIHYLNFLNSNIFKFKSKTDYGKGHSLENQPQVIGVLEYGEHEDGTQFVVKSWTNTSMIAVLYVASKKEVNYNLQELFLHGIRF